MAKIRIPLSDPDYIAAKRRGNDNNEEGTEFENLIILYALVAIGGLAISKGESFISDVYVQHHPTEFIDDLKIGGNGWTRYVHAKSGRSVRWDRNLKRDFDSQPSRVPRNHRAGYDLFVRSVEKKDEMRGKRPANLHQVRILPLSPSFSHSPILSARIKMRLSKITLQHG